MTLRIYADTRLIDHGAPRQQLTDIARALWGTVGPGPAGGAGFEAAVSPEEADLCLLPMKWQYYVERGLQDLAREADAEARRVGKPLVVFSGGDFPANLPFPGAVLFEASVRRSRPGPRTYAYPVLFPDLVAQHFGGELPIRNKGAVPVIGFCGQAARHWLPAAARWTRMRLRRLAYAAGWRTWEPPEVEHTLLRRRVLRALERGGRVETRFVVRERYRAGLATRAQRDDPFEPTRVEFVRNLAETDYTVCVRGGGNFSVRFYEVLCMGRIPVYIDTDGLLPFMHILPWKELCVWVEAREIPHAAEKVADYHHALSPSAFVERQRELRAIWEGWLTGRGFYGHFHEYFPELRGAGVAGAGRP